MRYWQTSRRKIDLDRTLVMAVLNVTPDSFSDGGQHLGRDEAIKRVEIMITEGADIIDIGGESTRPGSERVTEEIEIERVAPVIAAINERFDIPISIDTSKSSVAKAALAAGAEIVNDISGLRFDQRIAEVAAKNNTGLILMHSRGEFHEMHGQRPVDDIMYDVAADFRRGVDSARVAGIRDEQIVLDVGIGFGKTLAQNLELIANIDKLATDFANFPFLIGASRKSFIGKILGDAPADKRLSGSLAAAAIAVWNGAKIIRVHDIKETVDCVRMIETLLAARTG